MTEQALSGPGTLGLPSRSFAKRLGIGILSAGVVLSIVAIYIAIYQEDSLGKVLAFLGCSVVVLGLGVAVAQGMRLQSGSLALGKLRANAKFSAEQYMRRSVEIREATPLRILEEDEVAQREAYVKERAIPGENAPAYEILRDRLAVKSVPIADRMAPMYLLDRKFRIVDWNEAFSLAFDRTMEGRRGHGVLEWTYFLDNYETVVDHGIARFGDETNLTAVDVETVEFTSRRYGKISGKKRAYRLPGDDGDCIGWLIIISPKFRVEGEAVKFRHDLIRVLGHEQLWSEYALTYDLVLSNTEVYNGLLADMLGERGDLPAIEPGSRVMDLGAGTGNLTARLLDQAPETTVYALENNYAMFDLLCAKCEGSLRDDDEGPGVIPVKQDVTSLYGFQDDYFDSAIMNNVLYSLSDPLACLREVLRVLKPGGDVRISGPKRDTDLEVLFERIREDLVRKGQFDRVEEAYQHVLDVNRFRLGSMLYRMDLGELSDLLREAGFSEITHRRNDAYEGQAMLVRAVK